MFAKTFKLFSLFLFAGLLGVGSAMAQGDTEVTDEDLRSYIIVMDSVDQLRAQMSEEVSTMIVNHELMDGGRTYSKIKKADGEYEQLQEEGITEEQIQAYEEIEAEVEEKKSELNSTFSEMVKEHIGVAEYNKIRKGLRNDEELKARHDALAAEMNEEEETLEEGGETPQEAAVEGEPAQQQGATRTDIEEGSNR